LAVVALAHVEGRAVDIDDDVSAGKGLGLRRALRVPDVLANVHADGDTGYLEDLGGFSCFEITHLVEDAVIRQELLVVDTGDPPVVNNGGGVEDIVPDVDVADNGGDTGESDSHRIQGFDVVLDEVTTKEKVLGWVAGDR